jgi:hypothetical protein
MGQWQTWYDREWSYLVEFYQQTAEAERRGGQVGLLGMDSTPHKSQSVIGGRAGLGVGASGKMESIHPA